MLIPLVLRHVLSEQSINMIDFEKEAYHSTINAI